MSASKTSPFRCAKSARPIHALRRGRRIGIRLSIGRQTLGNIDDRAPWRPRHGGAPAPKLQSKNCTPTHCGATNPGQQPYGKADSNPPPRHCLRPKKNDLGEVTSLPAPGASLGSDLKLNKLASERRRYVWVKTSPFRGSFIPQTGCGGSESASPLGDISLLRSGGTCSFCPSGRGYTCR